jgi:hypothetical protein
MGQSSTLSPYSRYGIGDMDEDPGIQGFSMGNTGAALHGDSVTPYYINLKNPASVRYNRITTFEAGVLNNNISLSSGGTTNTANNTYFGYFAVAMPLGKYAGFGFGIQPMSSLGYDILTSSNIDSNGVNVGSVSNEYTGTGGINRVFANLAFSLPIPFFRNLSFGINGSYLFGNLTNTQTVVYPLNYTAFDGIRTTNVNIRDAYFSYGLMYTLYLPKSWEIVLGGTIAPNANINASYNLLSTNSMNGIVYDTIQDSNVNGKLRLPVMYTGGITIKKGDIFTFTADYSIENWSQYSYFGQQQNLSNSTKMGFGFEYHPSKKKKDGTLPYTRRIYYRAGFSYTQSYLDLYNTPLKEYAFTAGVGLPVGRWAWPWPIVRANVLNLGIQLGQFGTTSNNLLKEEYFKFMVGITFNDKWFIKRQYE